MSRKPNNPMMSRKENLPGAARNAPITRSLASATSQNNHTKPLKNGLANRDNGVDKVGPAPRFLRPECGGASSSQAPPPSFKRPDLSATSASPAKVAKVEIKPPTVAPKIASYNYRTMYNDLLGKHKVMRRDYTTLIEKHDVLNQEYEKVKDAVQSNAKERDEIKEQLLHTLAENDRLKILHDELNQEYEKVKDAVQRDAKERNELKEELLRTLAEKDRLKILHDELNQEYEKVKDAVQCNAKDRDELNEELLHILAENDRLKIDYHEIEDLQHKNRLLEEIIIRFKMISKDLARSSIMNVTRLQDTLKAESLTYSVLSELLEKVSTDYEKLQLDYKCDTEAKQNI